MTSPEPTPEELAIKIVGLFMDDLDLSKRIAAAIREAEERGAKRIFDRLSKDAGHLHLVARMDSKEPEERAVFVGIAEYLEETVAELRKPPTPSDVA